MELFVIFTSKPYQRVVLFLKCFWLFYCQTLNLQSQSNFGQMIGLLCNGSTTDFDSVCLGSNPGNPTKKGNLINRLPFLI